MQSDVQSLVIILFPLPCLADSSKEPRVIAREQFEFWSSGCDPKAYLLVFMLGLNFR